jgi:hypothetical protein
MLFYGRYFIKFFSDGIYFIQLRSRAARNEEISSWKLKHSFLKILSYISIIWCNVVFELISECISAEARLGSN